MYYENKLSHNIKKALDDALRTNALSGYYKR